MKRIRGKKRPLTAAGVQGLREEYTRTIDPARARAVGTLTLERTLGDPVNQACGLMALPYSFFHPGPRTTCPGLAPVCSPSRRT